jgi:hypothetical protein
MVKLEKIDYVENNIGGEAIKKLASSKTYILDDLTPSISTKMFFSEISKIHCFDSNFALFSMLNIQCSDVFSSKKQDVILVIAQFFGTMALVKQIKAAL